MESIGPIITKPIHNPNVRIMSGPHRVVVVSFALMLYYTLNIQALGMKEIWLQNGTRGALWHMLPLHQAVSHLGAPHQDSDQGTYALETEDDCMGQVGIKHAVMASERQRL